MTDLLSQTWRDVRIKNVIIEINDLKKIYNVLSKRQENLLEKRKAEFIADGKDLERKDEIFKNADDAYRVTVIIVMKNGDNIIGTESKILDNDQIVGSVSGVIIDTSWRHKSTKGEDLQPNARVEISLDDTSIFNPVAIISSGSMNKSFYKVTGMDGEWCSKTLEEIGNCFYGKSSFRNILHEKFIYDFLMWFAWIPLFVFFLLKNNIFLKNIEKEYSIIVIYFFAFAIFMIYITLFRFIFDYFRWLFPPVEIKEFAYFRQWHRWALSLIPIGGIAWFITKLVF